MGKAAARSVPMTAKKTFDMLASEAFSRETLRLLAEKGQLKLKLKPKAQVPPRKRQKKKPRR